ncbi:MAG TPA: glycosyltransferase [Gammaproteobacteria bacterium]|nr:glycosyltransferase [Gammaproteobacteria bacterium]
MGHMKHDISVCFVAHNAYGALAELDNNHVGGIEHQQGLMARWLASKGYDVSMITWDEGYADNSRVSGVKLYALCSRDDGIPVLRFAFPRWYSLIKAMKEANADIYYYNCGDLALGQIVKCAHDMNKRVFYTIANEVDCLQSLPALKEYRERMLYKYGLRRADRIITQTNRQKEMLESEYNLHSEMIPMPCVGFEYNDEVANKNRLQNNKKRILWIGRFSKEKRLHWLLDIAERRKEYQFDILGNANIGSEYANNCVERIGQMDNVTLHGRVLHKEISKFYINSNIICSTSEYEGFPNVYLEAWSVGLPIVTTFDPDGVVSGHDLGFVVNSRDDVIDSIDKIFSNDDLWLDMSSNAYQYYINKHTIDKTMPQFENKLLELVSGNQRDAVS